MPQMPSVWFRAGLNKENREKSRSFTMSSGGRSMKRATPEPGLAVHFPVVVFNHTGG